MSSEISASFCISGESLDFDECTMAAGILPTTTYIRPFGYDASIIPHRQWIFEIPRTTLESVDDAIKLLLTQLSGVADKLAVFAKAKDYDISIGCSVAVFEDRPLYELAPETIRRLACLHARFSLGITDYSEE